MDDDLVNQMIGIVEQMLANGEQLDPALERQVSEIISSSLRPIEGPLPNGTELLWQLAGGNPDAFASYLKTVPDQSLNSLLNNPNRLSGIIDQLESSSPMPQGQMSEEGIPKAPLQSSNIYGYKYNPGNKHLYVKFQGEGNQGPVYEYEGVPPEVFKQFQNAAVPAKTSGSNKYGAWWVGKQNSIGANFYEIIKKAGYPYARVS